MPRTCSFGEWTTAILLPLALLTAHPAAAVDKESARVLVSSAAADAMAAFSGKTLTPDEARTAVRPLIAKYSDMEIESRQITGRYWKMASHENQQEFASLLERFIITTFGRMVDGGIPVDRSIEVKTAESRGSDRVVVHSAVHSAGAPPTPVDWVVMDSASGRPVIVDISADGVTLVTTMSADFTSVIRAASGKLEALFDPIRHKISSP